MIIIRIYRTGISKHIRLILESKLRPILLIYKGKGGHFSKILLSTHIHAPQRGTQFEKCRIRISSIIPHISTISTGYTTLLIHNQKAAVILPILYLLQTNVGDFEMVSTLSCTIG